MIEGKDRKWHHKKTIELWEDIAENNLYDKMDSDLCQEYSPYLDCFLCEYYFYFDDTDCGEFPMFNYFQNDLYGSYGCMNELSPYYKWSNSSNGKKYAKEFLDWLKETLEV